MRVASLVALSAATRAPPPQLNFFEQFMPKPQSTPADVYNPDASAPLPGLPTQYDEIYESAAQGIKAAVADGISVVEVDFPPIANVNRLSDGSAKSEKIVHEANAAAAAALKRSLEGEDMRVAFIGCSGGSRSALKSACGEASSLRDGAPADSIALVVQPTAEEQWEAAETLQCRCVVVLNGLLSNGMYSHAYYYKPLTAFSTVTGGVVRRYPGPYTCYSIDGKPVDLEVGLTTQGRRALPDTKVAQMKLQNEFGSRQ